MLPASYYRRGLRSGILLFVAVSGIRLPAQMTETPETIAPGKFLLRMDAITVGVNPDTSAPNQYRATGAGWALLSTGLASDLDIEVGTQVYVRDTYQVSGANHTQSGIGAVSLRSKWTFWENADKTDSVALIPYVTLPTHNEVGGSGHTEGGLIMPWESQLAPGLKAGAMAEVDELRNVADTRYDTRLFGSGFLQFNLLDKLGVYGEATLGSSTGGSSASWGTLNAGATLSVSSNFQWDYEIGRLIGPSATQWNQTLRFRWKF